VKPRPEEALEEEAKVENVVLPVVKVQGVERPHSIKSVAGKIERRQSLSPPATPVRMVAHPGAEASGAAGFEEAKKNEGIPDIIVTPQTPAPTQVKHAETQKKVEQKVVRDVAEGTVAAAAAVAISSQAKKAVEPEKKVEQKVAPTAAPPSATAVAPQVNKTAQPTPKLEQSPISTRDPPAPAQVNKPAESEKKVGIPTSPSPRAAATPQASKTSTPAPQPTPRVEAVVPKTAPTPTTISTPVITKPVEVVTASPPTPPHTVSPIAKPSVPAPSVQFSVSKQSDTELKDDMPSVTAVIARLSVQSESLSNRTSLLVESPSSRVHSTVEVTPESPRGSLYEVAPTAPLVISKKEAAEAVPTKRMSTVSVAPMLPALEQNIRFSFGDLS